MSNLNQLSKLPDNWKVLPFLEAVKDVTGGNSKIKQADAKTIGVYPVVDQGQQENCGFIDNKDDLCREELPAILFGDHTKILKFIDYPFALGADGVKVLSSKAPIDKKFLFYFLKTLKLPENAGYSRHYKFLKDAVVPLPPLPEQKRIAAILDKADSLRRKNQQAIQLADKFLRAVFLDMFGDPVTNPKGIKLLPITECFQVTTGRLNSNVAIIGGKYPFFTCAKEIFAIDEYAFDQEALLLAGNNAQAEYDVKHYKGKFNAYQRTYVLTLKNSNWSYPFYKFALEYQLESLKRTSKGTSTKYITMEIMNRTMLPAPSVEKQNEFSAFFKKQEAINRNTLRLTELSNNCFESLSQKAFAGKL